MSPFLLLALLAPGQDAESVLVADRQARLVILDPVNRQSEIRREERLWIAPHAVRIEDLTFGQDLIFRLDRKSIIQVDRPARTHSEIGFDDLAAHRNAYLRELVSARDRVRGTFEESVLDRILSGISAGAPRPSLQATGQSHRFEGRDCPEWQLLSDDKVQVLKLAVDSQPGAGSYLEALVAAHALPEEALRLEGLPVMGVLRFALFLDRIQLHLETTRLDLAPSSPVLFEPPPGSLPATATQGVREIPIPEPFQPR